MRTFDNMDTFINDKFSAIKRHSVHQIGEIDNSIAHQVPHQRQINPEEISIQMSGGQWPQVMQITRDDQSSMEQSSSRHVSSTASAEQSSNRLGSRIERRSSTSEVLDLHRSTPLQHSKVPSSTLGDNVWEDQSESPVSLPERLRNPHQDETGRAPSYRSLQRTSWIEQSNLSSGSLEQKITFSYEHSTAPGARLPQKDSTPSGNQRSPHSEEDHTNSPFIPDQRTTWHSNISPQNSPIKYERQRIVCPSGQIALSSPFRCENMFSQRDNINNSGICPEQQLQQNILQDSARFQQIVDHNFDVSAGPLSKPKLVRLRSEPCAFNTMVSDASVRGFQHGLPDSRKRREDLKRSLSFEVTLPSYFETLWASLSVPSQLVVTRSQVPTSRLNRRHLSLHLEGVSGDLDSFRTEPPLQFHDTHSDNIELQNGKTRARRLDSFCMGICFTNRPVAINEKVYLKVVETNIGWSGLLRFGFTSVNPSTLRGCDLPRYACPDMTSKPGNWAKALEERYTSGNILLYFSVNRSGDVFYGVNGEEQGVFFSGVVTSQPLWVLLDIYGNTVGVEFSHTGAERELQAQCDLGTTQECLDSNIHNLSNVSLNNASSSPQVSSSSPLMHSHADLDPPPLMHSHADLDPPPLMHSHADLDPPPLMHSHADLDPPPLMHSHADLDPPSLMHSHADLDLTPLQFHPLQGRNVSLSSDGFTATRLKHEYCNAVVFTTRPVCCGETLVIQIMAIDRSFAGDLGFGMTACDPAGVDPSSLPDDSDVFMDRQEYWVVNKDVCSNPEVGDELSFCLTEDGEVRYARNNKPPLTLMHVDPTLPLWAFFDIYGNITKIKLIGTTMTTCQGLLGRSPTMTSCCGISMGDCVPGSFDTSCGAPVLKTDTHSTCNASPVAVASDIHRSNSIPTSCFSSSGEYADEAFDSYPTSAPSTPLSPNSQGSLEEEAADCKVCWERLINCVLYTCGHMCLCFDCALIIRSEKGLCPICRQSIVDVIKIYKS